MAAEYTIVRDENTSLPLVGVVVFSGGFDYIVGNPAAEDGLPSAEDVIDRYVESTEIDEDDLTVEDYKIIALLGFQAQGLMIDSWSQHKNRSSASKELKKLLKEAQENFVPLATKNLQALLVESVEDARTSGSTYDDPETGLEDVDAEDVISYLLNNIDPDGPDGWRVKHLLEEQAKTN